MLEQEEADTLAHIVAKVPASISGSGCRTAAPSISGSWISLLQRIEITAFPTDGLLQLRILLEVLARQSLEVIVVFHIPLIGLVDSPGLGREILEVILRHQLRITHYHRD